jgi:RNA polymerase-binding transcription factor DksA
MRQHFHRCPNLRLVTVDARDLAATRGRGHVVLDELCAANRLNPCVGLVECEILDAGQRRSLLAARATRLREEEGAVRSALADVPDPRADELAVLSSELLEERRAITDENRRLLAEATAASDWGLLQPARATEGFESAGVSSRLDDSLRALRSARLDAIDRALEAIAGGDPLFCLRCRRRIELERLRESPDARVCEACARAAVPPEPSETTR